MTREEIEEIAVERGKTAVLLDGYDGAIVGYTEDSDEMRVVYDKDRCIDCLVSDGMSVEDAEYHFGYNTLRSLPYIKEGRPIILYTE